MQTGPQLSISFNALSKVVDELDVNLSAEDLDDAALWQAAAAFQTAAAEVESRWSGQLIQPRQLYFMISIGQLTDRVATLKGVLVTRPVPELVRSTRAVSRFLETNDPSFC